MALKAAVGIIFVANAIAALPRVSAYWWQSQPFETDTHVPNLPDQVRRYVLASVSSVPQLEAILLLRAAPSVRWTPALTARRLYVSETRAAELLASLEESGIARRLESGDFVYAAQGELDALLVLVADSYATDLLGITQLIHSRVDRRARQFADAFRIRKPGGGS